MVPCTYRDGIFPPGFGRTCHEIIVTLCRAFSRRHLFNCIAVRSNRYGSVANRATSSCHSYSQHHRRRAEAGGKATEAGGKATGAGGKATEAGGEAGRGGKATRVRSGGKHGCTSPDIPTRTNAGARFNNGEARSARENLQQLRRWLHNKFQVRQPTLEWMLRFGG